MTALAILKRVWPYLAAVVVVLAAQWAAYTHGKTTERHRLQAAHAEELRKRDQATAQALAEAAEKSRQNLANAQEIARQNMEARQAIQAAFDELSDRVQRYAIENPGAGNCGIDPDGLRIWTDANRGRPASAAAAGNP